MRFTQEIGKNEPGVLHDSYSFWQQSTWRRQTHKLDLGEFQKWDEVNCQKHVKAALLPGTSSEVFVSPDSHPCLCCFCMWSEHHELYPTVILGCCLNLYFLYQLWEECVFWVRFYSWISCLLRYCICPQYIWFLNYQKASTNN